jgi:putative transposase
MKNNGIPLLPEHCYHIYNHANGRENIFSNHENYLFFLRRYSNFISPVAETYAYCLMPNHLHFLVRIKDEVSLLQAYLTIVQNSDTATKAKDFTPTFQTTFLSRQFASLFSSYSQAYNKQQGRKGSLFIPNFKRKLVESEVYFTKLVHYIHANPVHHGFIRNLEEWNYSSYQAFSSTKPTSIERSKVLDWFGGIEAFQKFHKDMPIDPRMSLEFE